MITGDHQTIAIETARVLHLGTNILNADKLPVLDPVTKQKPDNLIEYSRYIVGADGFAHVYPEHKYLIVECLRECGYKVGMTGDGVNDAPALKRADVGIAVQGATDAARAAADIILTQEGLSVIVEAILISRCIFERIRNFIIYRVAATLQLLCFFFIAVFAFDPSQYATGNDDTDIPEFFHMPVLMLMLITLLNDGTLISIGYDNVTPQMNPAKWNLPVVFLVSTVLGGVACVSSLLLLYVVLVDEDISYAEVMTCVYLKISVSDFLTLFSARAGPNWFWHSRPSLILIMAGGTALTLSTILACWWPESSPDDIDVIGLCYDSNGVLYLFAIWLYCLVWFLIQVLIINIVILILCVIYYYV
jgi:H+-transporting ATPase